MPEETQEELQEEETIARIETPTDAKPKAETIARTIAFVVVWVNQLFAFIGMPTLNIDEEAIYAAVSTLITFCVSIWAWWKNNSFTSAAIAGDSVVKALKDAGKDN